MIDLKSFGDLSELDLGGFAAKPTSFTDGQVEAAKELWASTDGLTKIGVWECTPGRFSADRTKSSEICHVLRGSATVEGKQGGGCPPHRSGRPSGAAARLGGRMDHP